MDFPDTFAPLSPGDHFNIADLVADDWLGPAVNAADLTDFPDDAIAASLAAFSGREDDDVLGFSPDRQASRSPAMRGSYSMNDLQALQHQPVHAPVWNHKLVSVKPKLQSVPESGPYNGGPLNLMPLPSLHQPGGMSVGDSLQPMQSPIIPGLDTAMEDFADLDSDGPDCLHKRLASTGSLAQQLQMTHVRSDNHLPGMDQHAAYTSTHSMHQVNASGIYQAPSLANGQHQQQHSHHHQQLLAHQQQQQQDPDQECGEGSAAGQEGQQEGVRRNASGLPLRKSQSAVELGSWRSFGCPDDFWDQEGPNGEPLKAWKLTPEERMLRIQRYREKRLNRNFNPAVKYQCRKSLADTRPRVRGRFARNDDVGIVLPHETKKAQREKAGGASGSSTDVGSSEQTSSGGGGTPSGRRNGGGMAHAAITAPNLAGGSGGLQQGATSQLTGMFGLPAHHHHMPNHPLNHHDVSTASAPTTLHGISMIGASPQTLLQPDLGASLGMVPMQGSGAATSSMLPPLVPSTFPPIPPVIGPSTGGIFSGATQRTSSTGMRSDFMAVPPSTSMYNAPQPGSSMMYNGMMPPYMSAGQTIFTGQTIFSGGSSMHAAGNVGVGGYQPPSGTASAHPSVSPPLHAISPAASDSHSHSHSVGLGLSMGDISSL